MKRFLALIATSSLALGIAGTALAQNTAPSTAPQPSTTSGSNATAPSGTNTTPGSSSMSQTSPGTDSSAQNMQKGSQGKSTSQNRAKTIQTALNNNGEQVNVDGKIGPKTVAALKDFQQKHGLKVTGRADKATLSQLHTTTTM